MIFVLSYSSSMYTLLTVAKMFHILHVLLRTHTHKPHTHICGNKEIAAKKEKKINKNSTYILCTSDFQFCACSRINSSPIFIENFRSLRHNWIKEAFCAHWALWNEQCWLKRNNLSKNGLMNDWSYTKICLCFMNGAHWFQRSRRWGHITNLLVPLVLIWPVQVCNMDISYHIRSLQIKQKMFSLKRCLHVNSLTYRDNISFGVCWPQIFLKIK